MLKLIAKLIALATVLAVTKAKRHNSTTYYLNRKLDLSNNYFTNDNVLITSDGTYKFNL